jgi:hypothetical protein
VKSGIWHMLCISKARAEREKLVSVLESAGQIYPETSLTFEAPKCVLASLMGEVIIQTHVWFVSKYSTTMAFSCTCQKFANKGALDRIRSSVMCSIKFSGYNMHAQSHLTCKTSTFYNTYFSCVLYESQGGYFPQ